MRKSIMLQRPASKILESRSKTHDVLNQKPERITVALAWAAGWLLFSMGQMLSGMYNLPNNGETAFTVLGLAGWAIAAAFTIRYLRRHSGADARITALSVVGWSAGTLEAVILWSFWAHTAENWQAGFLGPVLSPTLGGLIGGALTLPLKSLSSPAAILRASLRGALCWGAGFLIFQSLAFYAGYFLMLMTVAPLAPIVGWVWAEVPGWALTAGVGGFLAGWLGSFSLGSKKQTLV